MTWEELHAQLGESGAVGGGDVLADLGVQVSTDSLCPEDQVVSSCHSGPRSQCPEDQVVSSCHSGPRRRVG